MVVEEDGEADVKGRSDDDEDGEDELLADPASHEAVEDDVHDPVDGGRAVPDDSSRQVFLKTFISMRLHAQLHECYRIKNKIRNAC